MNRLTSVAELWHNIHKSIFTLWTSYADDPFSNEMWGFRGKCGSRDRSYFLGLQNNLDSSCSHEIKRRLLLGRKAVTNLNSILKSKDITLLTKVHIVKVMVSMWRCESWTIKKAEHQRIDAFELWCWRRLLKAPWATRRSNQSILKEINPEYLFVRTDAEAETPIHWPPDTKSWPIGKDPEAGKDWRQEEKKVAEDEMVR